MKLLIEFVTLCKNVNNNMNYLVIKEMNYFSIGIIDFEDVRLHLKYTK